MALIFLGSTSCALCGKTLLEGDDIRGLPAFAPAGHPLYAYSDAGFHAACFEAWPEREEALRQIEALDRELINSDRFKEWVAKHGWPDWLKKREG
ncbi:hypothetical protein [Hymenobacter edaphi]|uniref:hypothetical protein n=1 Tax=Hymenobacter edaphi TaxID=2211146 RepID=UPI001057E6DF|nr:hypothetical protein [Hymenobacter edaphi]